MPRISKQSFDTVTTQGGLFSPEFLARVAAGGGKDAPEGLTPADYHLPGSERLTEAVNRSWNVLRGRWEDFQKRTEDLRPEDAATGVTRDYWLLPLFQELGFGRLQSPAQKLVIEDRDYPISHMWGSAPIHLLGVGLGLDHRTPGAAGAARMSPYSTMQEYLNRAEGALWGVVSNGRVLRLLRDNAALTRQAYVEFDLQAMFEGNHYSDFSLLWLLCHQSCFEGDRPELCRLEKWTQLARKQGARLLEHLRDGVEKAIETLGTGFIAHPANQALRDKLHGGLLNTQDYYRQILRLVYRLIFLFVAEDRDLLLLPSDAKSDTRHAARTRYFRFYSTRRLRELALKRSGTAHGDLWEMLSLVMRTLGSDEGCPSLALPALGSFLWRDIEAVPDLAGQKLANRHLLDAIRALAAMRSEEEKVRRVVDYRNLGAEELGSVYESLLELHPKINLSAQSFSLATAAGNERKTSGSYYTPDSLVQCLLDTALDPVVDEAVRGKKGENAAKAILSLKVCDPAVGSGHFLIAAAHRMARRVAAFRSGEEEAAPGAVHTALRDVIGHCLYGVDINPMAAELCRVSLWLEALEPGKPLSFLDHHIRVGNSLLGTTPDLVAAGIPDAAFDAIEGDDKKVCSALRKRNREERRGEQDMLYRMVAEPRATYISLADRARGVEAAPDETLTQVQIKAEQFGRLTLSPEYRDARRLADAWCAAFVWVKRVDFPGEAITTDTVRRLSADRNALSPAQSAEVERLAAQYCFFHWHLAFPEVFQVPETSDGEASVGPKGGFDLVLGNPPWDTLSPDAKEFFSAYNPTVRFCDENGQQALISDLLAEPAIAKRWTEYRRQLFGLVHFLKQSGRYTLYADGNLGKGDFNIYRMFVELALRTVRFGGRCAQLVPEGIYNGANCAAIRGELLEHARWERLLGFENARGLWFSGIDTRMKFALYTAAVPGETASLPVRFGIRTLDDLAAASRGETLRLPVHLIRQFSPDAVAVMEFTDQRDVAIAAKMYARWPKFGDESAGPPMREYMREVDMGNDRYLFTEDPAGVPVYEGRMVDQYDHRAKGYRGGRGRAAEWAEFDFGSAAKSIQPQWRIPRDRIPNKVLPRLSSYRVGFCDVTSPTNERSLVAALIPPGCVCGHKVPTVAFPCGCEWAYLLWLAVANSLTMDFLVRMKVSLSMAYTVLDTLPVPRLPPTDPVVRALIPLVLRLTCCGREMTPFWNARAAEGWCAPVGPAGPPPGEEDPEKRRLLRARIDALVARDLFALTPDELSYILGTFPIVKRKDEEDWHGLFRTKDLVLKAYEER